MLCVSLASGSDLKETLPPLKNGKMPTNVEELWQGFDPRAEPLDVEVLKGWEEDGVVFRVLRYRIGVFKGRKAMMAGIFGYPKGAKGLPGLVQIHGGGQYADHKAVLTNAKRGYATISIAWAGRISAPGYAVGPPQVKLFWDDKTDDPSYRVTTDWGALDGYHAPSRHAGNIFPKLVDPAPWTLDSVKSPRNNSWFLCALGARRALTFLEQQPQVDPDRLGVYGHSMGGKLTVLTTGSDDRVKAAAPSCGGISDRYNNDPLFRTTIGDDAFLSRIGCPIFFLSPANDFHGRINDLQQAIREVQSPEVRMNCAPHHNHQDTSGYEVATQLWFDQHLKKDFKVPETPSTKLMLREKRRPRFILVPDRSREILSVDVYYTQQGEMVDGPGNMENTKSRFWHHVRATPGKADWLADIPFVDPNRPLWIYANVSYPLKKKVVGAGYYYGIYSADHFTISSPMTMLDSDRLKKLGIADTLKTSAFIEDFSEGWEKEWFNYRENEWARKTHKIYDPRWKAPEGARLAFEVRAENANTLVVGIDHFAAEVKIDGGEDWQKIVLAPGQFTDADGAVLKRWGKIKELRYGPSDTVRSNKRGSKKRKSFGGPWKGVKPQLRDLRWEMK
ncbi:dienelactone hydrolase family protein [bacterium]|nr:dienelactone hydrolase family protein [bacterium]